MGRVSLDKMYMDMARAAARRSHCERKKVGAVAVKEGSVIGEGFNGNLPGGPNNCEDEDGNTLPVVCHAEINCLLKVAKSNNSTRGATIYQTMSSCFECARYLIQCEIDAVVFNEWYRDRSGTDLLEEYGVDTYYLPNL